MHYRRYLRDSLKRKLYKNLELQQRLARVTSFYGMSNLLTQLVNKKYINTLFSVQKVRIKNYCVVTGRARSVYRKFKVSRIMLRSLGAEGSFLGLKKSS